MLSPYDRLSLLFKKVEVGFSWRRLRGDSRLAGPHSHVNQSRERSEGNSGHGCFGSDATLDATGQVLLDTWLADEALGSLAVGLNG